jgi:O-antigen biosynthesis protein WbqL
MTDAIQLMPIVSYPGNGIRGPSNQEQISDVWAAGAKAVTFRNAFVIGPGYICDADTNAVIYEFEGDGIFPTYVKAYTDNGMAPIYGRTGETTDGLLARASELESITLPACYTFIHFNLVYGHFLLEMAPKLLLIKELYEKGERFPIVLPSAIPQWLKPHIYAFFPEADLLVFDYAKQKVHAERIVAITGSNYLCHPAIIERFHRFSGAGVRGKRRIYVTRPDGHPTKRIFVNQAEIISIAREKGFEIVDPSSLAMRDQASLFAESAIVAGEFTSALHNTIFSPPGTATISINRVNIYQWLIANACGHYLDYVTPEGGNVEFSLELTNFQVSPADFVRSVESAVEFITL